MDFLDKWAKRVAIRSGVSSHESHLFYRDIGLALLFIPSGLLTVVCLAAFEFSAICWVSASVGALSLYYATKWGVLVAALFGMLGIRFAFGAVFFKSLSMFVAALGFSAIVLALAFSDRTPYPDSEDHCSNKDYVAMVYKNILLRDQAKFERTARSSLV